MLIQRISIPIKYSKKLSNHDLCGNQVYSKKVENEEMRSRTIYTRRGDNKGYKHNKNQSLDLTSNPDKETPRFYEMEINSIDSRLFNKTKTTNNKNTDKDKTDEINSRANSRGRASKKNITDKSSMKKILSKIFDNCPNSENFNDLFNLTFSNKSGMVSLEESLANQTFCNTGDRKMFDFGDPVPIKHTNPNVQTKNPGSFIFQSTSEKTCNTKNHHKADSVNPIPNSKSHHYTRNANISHMGIANEKLKTSFY